MRLGTARLKPCPFKTPFLKQALGTPAVWAVRKLYYTGQDGPLVSAIEREVPSLSADPRSFLNAGFGERKLWI
jgi:hypothetical protein